jgi:retrograde regulation protein 2
MSQSRLHHDDNSLRAFVDIGSNGIRFSISTVEPKHARIFPCLFQDRAAISLYDHVHPTSHGSYQSPTRTPETNSGANTPIGSEHPHKPLNILLAEKNEISNQAIEEVKQTLLRFKGICEEFGVQDHNVKVIATEATREAPNSEKFRAALTSATGWEVHLLSKVEEGRTGAYGVASSFYEVQGLYMDLGGGSTQISWMECKDGIFRMSDAPVSLPYGAAALTRRLNREPLEDIEAEMGQRLTAAINVIGIPESMKMAAQQQGGYKIYVSGGGFRGLGHLVLAHRKDSVYPLPIINGFSCTSSDIIQLIDSNLLGEESIKASKKTFRISERRAIQLPAVAMLVKCVLQVFPPIRKVMFSQGGVREGALFHDLPASIRSQDPLFICTSPYAPALAKRYIEVLLTTLPQNAPKVIRERIVPALVNVAFAHSSYPKELQPSAGLAIASTGLISGCHGLSHEVRALLGLALCQRWGGELADKTLRDSLIGILTPKSLGWWAIYCGNLMHVIGGVYPGGNVGDDLIQFTVEELETEGRLDRFNLLVQVNKSSPRTTAATVRSRIKNLEKKLKRLSKDFGSSGLKVDVFVEWV